MRLNYSAISDVGRVRKDNQDSGYAGPWLLTVCDGVGGAARGDVASSTAVQQLRRLDEAQPGSESTDELLGKVAGALHRAHDRIGELVDEDPALNGTSTTATVALFDGGRLGMGHVGDSRAYLYRDGAISQLTADHTFVQSLIDEGRINEQEARVHPHRNLILKALDGIHEAEPDLFVVDLEVGDRILLCSDGASGVLEDRRLADVLSMATPDYAAVELVRASLEAGSSDNVTCIVADVVADDAGLDPDLQPLLVGAAAELRRRVPRGAKTGSLFRGHRSGDTGELEPITAEIAGGPGDRSPGRRSGSAPVGIASDPLDPEAARYAPRPPARFLWLKRLLAALVVAGIVWIAAATAWAWSQAQYYVGEQDGTVVIFRGVEASLPGISLSTPFETSNVELDRLADFDAGEVRSGIAAADLAAARRAVQNLASKMNPAEEQTDPTPTPSPTPTPTPTPTPSPVS